MIQFSWTWFNKIFILIGIIQVFEKFKQCQYFISFPQAVIWLNASRNYAGDWCFAILSQIIYKHDARKVSAED